MRRRGFRKHRRRRADGANHERWLVSYADFITLLFAFFVVMYATSQVDKPKVAKLQASIQAAFQEWGPSTVPVTPTFDTMAGIPLLSPADLQSRKRSQQDDYELREVERELKTALAPEIMREEVALHFGPDGLVISLREVGFFRSGSSELTPNSRSAMERMVGILQNGEYRIRIEGHTDNVRIHNSQFASNWELSTARATELIRLLIIKYKFLPDRLSAAGYAEYHPLVSNDTEVGRAINRRLDVVILRTRADSSERAAFGQRGHPRERSGH